MTKQSNTPEHWLDQCKRISAGYLPGGDRSLTYHTGVIIAENLIARGFLVPGDRILDVGSGNGRLAMGLAAVEFPCSYTGLEVIAPCVSFCTQAFAGFDWFRFVHLDLRVKHYWPKGKGDPGRVVYPVPSESIDKVLALSMFSHTGTVRAARRNLGQMYRVLAPGGAAFTTRYLGLRDADEAKTVYPQEWVEGWFVDLGLAYEPVDWEIGKQSVYLLRKE